MIYQAVQGQGVFIAKRPLRSRWLNIDAGEPFPAVYQNAYAIRSIGPGYGVHDSYTRDLGDLDYVEIVAASAPRPAVVRQPTRRKA